MKSMPFRDGCFELVISLGGIEHLFRTEVDAFLAEVCRVLAPGGKFAGTTAVLNKGKHSGNPSHLFEYTDANIRAVLGQYFEITEMSVQDSVGAPVLFFVSDRRSVPLGDPAPTALPGEAVSEYLDATAREPTTLLETCLAVLLLQSSGELSRQPIDTRTRWGNLLLPPHKDWPFAAPPTDAPQTLDSEAVYSAEEHANLLLRALDALALRPRGGMKWLDELSRPAAIEKWLESLDWGDSSRSVLRATAVLDALVYRADRDRQLECAVAVHRGLDWLENQQDPTTGLWGHGRSPASLVATARAVALLEHTWRPVKNSVAIVDSTLHIQVADARFRPRADGASDLAAAALLATMSKYTRHRWADVRRALVRQYWAIWNAGARDGGDSFSAPARALALGVIAAALPGDVPPCSFAPLSWPGLGYFRATDALPEARREDVRVWLRSGSVDRTKPRAPVTLVITCYNLGRYLHEAIASVLCQTVVPERIVVVEDGSTEDFTRLVFDFWQYGGIEVVRQRNAGVAEARNNAIRVAGTEFICSMDADDRLHRNYFEKVVARIRESDRRGYVSCHYRLFDCGSDTYRYNNTRLPEMLVRNETCGISVFRKTAWEAAGGYCEKLTTGLEDWDFWIGILEAGYEGDVVTETLFDYRIRPGSRNRDAVAPARYEAACRIIAARHANLYQRFAIEVAALSARQFIEVANLRVAESESAARVIDRLTVQLEAEQESGRALDSGRKWLEQQVDQWTVAVRALEQQVDQFAQRAVEERQHLEETRTELVRQLRPGPVGRALRNAALFLTPSAFRSARNVLLWMKIRRDRELSQRWNDLFDAEWYARTYPDVEANGVNVALHYLTIGHLEGRRPSPRFDAGGGSDPPDVSPVGINPLVRAILYGDPRRSG